MTSDSPSEARKPIDYAAIEAAVEILRENGLRFLSPMELDIIRCFDGWEILPAHEIGRRTHYPNTPHFRAILTNLAERGVLRATSRGYHPGA